MSKSDKPKVGTQIYKEFLNYPYVDARRRQLMAEVWGPTPWIVSAYTERSDGLRMRDMVVWLLEHFGPEMARWHPAGMWQRGSVTMYGWTWIGFATEDMMQQFEAAWPLPLGVKRPN